MRRTLSLTLIAALLSTACAHPLSSLRAGMERRNAYTSVYVPSPDDTPACRSGVERLERFATAQRIRVLYPNIPEQIGNANWDERAVRIHVGLAPCGRLEVLAHELAHMVQPKALSRSAMQVFADGVSYLVVRRLGGYDPKERYLTYLGVLKESSHVLDLFRPEIEMAAEMLISGSVDLR